MKKFVLLLLSAAALVTNVPQLYAKAIFITPGARANSMGAAYIAVANDPTASYWNPAGLAQLARSGAEFSLFYVKNSATSNMSLGNAYPGLGNPKNGDFPLPRMYSTEPAQYNSKQFETTAPVPFLAGYHAFDKVTLAGGVYCIGGGGGKWSDTVAAGVGQDNINASVDASYMFMVYNLSAAMEVMPRLSAGFGVDMVTMTDKQNAKKQYAHQGTGSPSSYGLEIDQNAFGYGVQYNGGLLYRPMDTLRFGAVMRSGTKITLHGQAKYNQNGLSWLGSGYADLQYQTDYDQNYTYPFTYGLGVSYDPLPKWTLAAGLDFNQFSTKRDDVSYNTPLPGVFNTANADGGWKDTTQYRIGAEYRPDEKLSLRAGIQTDPSQVRTSDLTLLNLDQYNMAYYCVGAGYNFSFATVDLTLVKGISDKPGQAGRSYEYDLDIVRLSVDYSF